MRIAICASYLEPAGCAAGTCCGQGATFQLFSKNYTGVIFAGVTDAQWNSKCSPGPGAGTVIGYIVLVLVILAVIGGGIYYLRKRRSTGFSSV